MNGRPSSPDDRGSPPTHMDPGSSNFNQWWNNIRAILSSPPPPPPPPPPREATSTTILPRLQINNNLVSRPAMSIHQEMLLSRKLETVLKQVQSGVRGMDLEPVQLSDCQIVPITEREYSRRGLSYMFPESAQPSVKADLEGLDKKQQIKAIQLLDKYSRDMKAGISEGIIQKEVTEEYGKKLHSMVDCLDKNLKLALEARPSSFSLAGLMAKIPIPEKTQKLIGMIPAYINFAQVAILIAETTYDSIGTSPVHFGTIGNESRSFLSDDFTLEKMKLKSDPNGNFSAGFGAEKLGGQLLSQLMLKLKQDNISVSCKAVYETQVPNANGQVDPIIQANANAHNGPAADVATLRISANKLIGYDLKSTLLIPYPSLHGKFEIKGFNPYLSYGGCAELVRNQAGENRNPLLGISGVLGVKDSGLGFRFQYNGAAAENESRFVPSVGWFLRTELLAVGLTYKHHPGVYNASIVKKLVDTTTTVGLQASYSYEVGDNGGPRFAVGVKHAVDPTLLCKVKVATAGASLAVKKSFYDGFFCVKAMAHIDSNTPWQLPKLGILFSFCRPNSETSKKKKN